MNQDKAAALSATDKGEFEAESLAAHNLYVDTAAAIIEKEKKRCFAAGLDESEVTNMINLKSMALINRLQSSAEKL